MYGTATRSAPTTLPTNAAIRDLSYEEIRKNVELVLRFGGRCDRVNTDLRMYCAGVSCEDSVLFSKVLGKKALGR